MSNYQALLPQAISSSATQTKMSNAPIRKSSLDTIAPELILWILSYLPDVKSILPMLLVCKFIYVWSLSSLYEKFQYNISFPSRTRLVKEMVRGKIPGLMHIRELVLVNTGRRACTPGDLPGKYPWSQFCDSEIGEDATLEIVGLLEYLPQNVLRKFIWNIPALIPEKIISTLWSRQRHLSSIGFWPCEGNLDKIFWNRGKPVTDAMPKLKGLFLQIGADSPMPQAGKFVLQNLQISWLTIVYSLTPFRRNPLPNDGSHQLFGLPMVLDTVPVFSLRRLKLCLVDLERTTDDIAKTIHFHKLKELVIHGCKCPERFLIALTQSPNRGMLQLETLTIFHRNFHPKNSDFRFDFECPLSAKAPRGLVKLIDDYLTSSKNCLRSLFIVLRGYRRLPRAAGIMANGLTLKSILLDIRTILTENTDADNAVLYRRREWRALCKSLINVEQFAVAFPTVFTDGQMAKNKRFMNYLIATTNLPQLKTLNITTFPFAMQLPCYMREGFGDACPCPGPGVSMFYIYDDLVTRFAEEVVNALDNSLAQKSENGNRINVLVFGIDEYGPDIRGSLKPLHYHRLGSSTGPPLHQSSSTASFSSDPRMVLTTLEELSSRQEPIEVLCQDFSMGHSLGLVGPWPADDSGDGEDMPDDSSSDEDSFQ